MSQINFNISNQDIKQFNSSRLQQDQMFKILKENVLDKAALKANSESFEAGFMAVPLRRLMARTDINFAELGISNADFESWFFGHYQKDTLFTTSEWESQFLHCLDKVFYNENGVDFSAMSDRIFIASGEGVIHVEQKSKDVNILESANNPPKVQATKTTTHNASANSSSFSKVQTRTNSSETKENQVAEELNDLRKDAEKRNAQQDKQQIEQRRWMMRLVLQARKTEGISLNSYSHRTVARSG